jgi:hypothetical protein
MPADAASLMSFQSVNSPLAVRLAHNAARHIAVCKTFTDHFSRETGTGACPYVVTLSLPFASAAPHCLPRLQLPFMNGYVGRKFVHFTSGRSGSAGDRRDVDHTEDRRLGLGSWYADAGALQ